jgi:GntR family transcriptional regulator/MocR family aminotransferase
MALWARCAPEVDADAWAARAIEAGVAFMPGSRFTFDGRPLPAVRLGFASLRESELTEAIRRLARALPAR